VYARRPGEVLPHRDIELLPEIEGARVKESYRLTAERPGVSCHGRRYDRADPAAADLPNQALNDVASAIEGSGGYRCDRDDVTVPTAFCAAQPVREGARGAPGDLSHPSHSRGSSNRIAL